MGKKSKNKLHLQKRIKDDEPEEDDVDIEENSDLDAIDDNEIEEDEEIKKNNQETKALLVQLKQKIESKFNAKFNPKELFLERMTVVPKSEIEKNLNINDDIRRELNFYNLAVEGAVAGIINLKAEKQRINRPDDYMAEMLKSDEQMVKVKKEILSHESRIKQFQLREQKMLNKKFNKKTKTKQAKEGQEYKKVSRDAIEHWKNSIKENPDEYYKLDDYVNKSVKHSKNLSRKDRNKKYNPRLASQEKFKNANPGHGRGQGKPGKNFKKSGFNKSERAPQKEKRRPGKTQRTNMKNKRKSK